MRPPERPASRSPHYLGWSLHEPAADEHRGQADTKVLHFLRHGESLHQQRNNEAKTRGLGCRCFDEVPVGGRRGYTCPYWSEDLVDAPLTPLGREQLVNKGESLGVSLVLSSPMARSLESAVLAFPQGSPILVLPELRPRAGRHRHSKRSPRSTLERRFPSVDLSRIEHEEDTFWSEADESRESLERRAARFLNFAFSRPEPCIAVLTHFTLFLALLLPADDPWMLGPSRRPAGSPALVDCSQSRDPLALRGVVEVGEALSLLVRRAGDHRADGSG